MLHRGPQFSIQHLKKLWNQGFSKFIVGKTWPEFFYWLYLSHLVWLFLHFFVQTVIECGVLLQTQLGGVIKPWYIIYHIALLKLEKFLIPEQEFLKSKDWTWILKIIYTFRWCMRNSQESKQER